MFKVEVDEQKCKDIAEVMRKFSFVHPESAGRESMPSPGKELFYLFVVVGICHQINWNFLMKVLNKARVEMPKKFTPEHMQNMPDDELYDWLKEYPKRYRLGKKFRRGPLVRDMCKVLVKEYGGRASDILKRAKHKMGGKQGFYELLDDFEAYREDPLKKKSAVLIGLLEDWKLEKFQDWEKYIPPIDYHICRVLLRNGVIKVESPKLIDKLKRQEEVSQKEDTAIRAAAIKALNEISKYSGKGSQVTQGFYWCIGRECCEPEKPRCRDCPASGCTVHSYMKLSCSQSCPLLKACMAVGDPSLLEFKEQNFITTFY